MSETHNKISLISRFMIYLKYLLLLLLVISQFSCISDDDDDCERTMIRFSYLGDGISEIFDQRINKVDLYIYDANKNLVQTQSIGKDELKQNHGKRLNIPPGDYYIVCIGNAFLNTEIIAENGINLDNMRVTNPNILKKKDTQTNDSLYFGYKKIRVSESEHYLETNDTIHFVSSHIKMYIEIAGIENYLKDGDSLKISINNLFTAFNFSNEVFNDVYTYKPQLTYNMQKSIYQTKLNVLRIPLESEVNIVIQSSSDKQLYSLGLTSFLNKYKQFDLSKNELLIAIRIEFKPQSVSIKVPEWIIDDDIHPEL